MTESTYTIVVGVSETSGSPLACAGRRTRRSEPADESSP